MSKNLESIEKKIKQLQQQKNKILKAEKEKERKARTKRLIERGAMVEKYFDTSDFSNQQFKDLLERFINNPDFMIFLNECKYYIDNAGVPDVPENTELEQDINVNPDYDTSKNKISGNNFSGNEEIFDGSTYIPMDDIL